jgi:hypothetical protein
MNNGMLYTYACDTPSYQRKGKPEVWVKVKDAPEKMFRSYPYFEFIPEDGRQEPKRYGNFVIDIDTGDSACKDAIKIIEWFEAVFSVAPDSWMIFLSGKKGVHLELSPEVCGTTDGHILLPLAYKRLAKDIEGELQVTLDTSMYNRGTGKPYRQPNIMRDCGTCKRQVTYNDLFEIVAEDEYRAACSMPGELWFPEATISHSLSAKLQSYLKQAEEEQAKLEAVEPLTAHESEQLRKSEPPCVTFLRNNTAQGRSGATFNDVAMQLTGYAVTTGASEQQFISHCSGFIFGYPSSSLTNPEKRVNNCRDRFRCMAANGNQFDCGGMLSLGFSSWDFDCSKCDFKRNRKHVEIAESTDENDITTVIPDEILNPGGLISEIQDAMKSGGVPDIPQYNFPVALLTIARAISGKITLEGYWPNLYLVKIGPTSSGKSDADKFVKKRLSGIEGFYGSKSFASGPSMLRDLADRPNMLSIIDEVEGLFKSYGTKDHHSDEIKKSLLELHTETGTPYEKSYADKKNKIVINNPCLSISGNTTPLIFDSINPDDFRSGLMQRVDFFAYNGDIPYRSRKKKAMLFDGIAEKIVALMESDERPVIEQAMNGPVELEFSEAAENLMDEWSRQVIDDANAADSEGEIGILARRYESSCKFIMIHHASKNAQGGLCLPISAESVLWGTGLAKLLAEWKIRILMGKVTTGEFHKDCELFKSAIKAVTSKKSKVKQRPTFAMLANRRPALKNWERKKSESVIEILSKRGEIVIDESGRSTAYYLGTGVNG